MQVIHVRPIFLGVVPQGIGRTVCDTALDATTGQPEAESLHVMVSPDHTLTALSHGSSPKFTAPHDECILEEAAPLEVGNQTGYRLIH